MTTTCHTCDTRLDYPRHADRAPLRHYCEWCAGCDPDGDLLASSDMCDWCAELGNDGVLQLFMAGGLA